MTPAETTHERFLKTLHGAVFMLDRYADRLLSDSRKGTFSHFLLMIAIAKCGGASQQKIAEFLNLTPAAVSRQVDALVEAGLIARKDDPNSRRAHVISLTEAGKKRVAEMRTELLASFEEATASVSVDELERANGTIESVVRAIEPACAVRKFIAAH